MVLNCSRSKDRVEAIADELGRDHCTVIGAEMDDWRQLENLWWQAVEWKGGVDVLVNNAAKCQAVDLDAPTAEWDAHWIEAFRINLLATAHMSRFAIQHYRERGGGIIIGITARIAVRGDRPEYFHDGAAKGGIARFCAEDGVLSYLICAGIIETDQSRDFVEHYGMEEAVREIPLGELGQPQDIADVVTILASGKAR